MIKGLIKLCVFSVIIFALVGGAVKVEPNDSGSWSFSIHKDGVWRSIQDGADIVYDKASYVADVAGDTIYNATGWSLNNNCEE